MIKNIKKIILFNLFYNVYNFLNKCTRLPFLKDKHSIFYNEWLSIIPIFYKNIFKSSIYQTGNFINN